MTGFPGGSVARNPPANTGDVGSIPGLGQSWRRKWQPTQVLLPGKSHGQRSLADCCRWGYKESDLATKQQKQHPEWHIFIEFYSNFYSWQKLTVNMG